MNSMADLQLEPLMLLQHTYCNATLSVLIYVLTSFVTCRRNTEVSAKGCVPLSGDLREGEPEQQQQRGSQPEERAFRECGPAPRRAPGPLRKGRRQGL